MKSTTSGQHAFSQIPRAEIQRSVFNRSCGLKTTFDGGWLVPFFVEEALPGDTMSLRANILARLATPLAPTMDNMTLDTHFFSVPMRLLWNKWEEFNGHQDSPGNTTDYTIPVMDSEGDGHQEQTLGDYFGIPTKVPDLIHSSLYHRAYNLIYNEWYRDQNVQDSVTTTKGNGPDLKEDYIMLRRGKRHDYFTSCLPWPQKGPSVTIPLGDTAPVVSVGGPPTFTANSVDDLNIKGVVGINTDVRIDDFAGSGGSVHDMYWDDTQLEADLSQATAQTINQLRQAFQIQRLYERDARGGSRYTEICRAHFGVISPDSRLQRPEYLGGGSQRISVTPVPQTAATGVVGTPQGNLAAYGVSTGSGHTFNKSFVEHTIIIGLVSVRADLNYQQGLSRAFSRSTRWDFFWPALAHLGEQAVLNKEIFAQGSDDLVADEAVFGYQERFAEYRYKPSQITGKMRSNATASLDLWHLAQDFDNLPLLSNQFMKDVPPIDRIIAVPTEPHFLMDCFFEFKHARPMPTYSTPGMIDHF